MNPVDNPYTPGAGTPPPELAGRDEILLQATNTIKRTLNQKFSKSQILLGLRGVGKTVLLNRINQIAEAEGCHTAIFEAMPDTPLPTLIAHQLQRVLLKLDRRKRVGEDVQRAFRLLRGFASAFKVKVGEFEVGLNNEGVTGDLTIDLSDLLILIGEAARKRSTAVILLIDEMQYLTKNDLGSLIAALHRIAQKALPLLFFGAGLPQIARLSGDAKTYSERLFDFPGVDKLNRKDAILALTKPALKEGVKFSSEAVDMVLEETGGYPYFLQVWGSHIWEVTRHSPVRTSEIHQATSRSIQALDSGFFKVRTDRLSERQLAYVFALARCDSIPAKSSSVAGILGMPVTKAAPLREELINKGIVYSPNRGYVDFSVPKFREYLLRNFLSIITKK